MPQPQSKSNLPSLTLHAQCSMLTLQGNKHQRMKATVTEAGCTGERKCAVPDVTASCAAVCRQGPSFTIHGLEYGTMYVYLLSRWFSGFSQVKVYRIGN